MIAQSNYNYYSFFGSTLSLKNMYSRHIKEILSSNKTALIYTFPLAMLLISVSWHYETLPKTLTYFVTLILCFLGSEIIYVSSSFPPINWKIKKGRRELVFVCMVQTLAIALMIYVFGFVDPSEASKVHMIFFQVLRLVVVFPTALLIYFLAIQKYRLKEIGFNFHYWFVAIPIIILLGGISFLLFPDGLQFKMMYQQHGFLAFIGLGFLTAALPEELMRNLFQTRLSTVISKPVSWFIVSFIWALTHIPSFGAQNQDYVKASWNAIGILPLGLLWGYLNERYKSIIPSILIHGTNLWGLQNIF